jgi:hypothetical protein
MPYKRFPWVVWTFSILDFLSVWKNGTFSRATSRTTNQAEIRADSPSAAVFKHPERIIEPTVGLRAYLDCHIPALFVLIL